MEAAAIIALVRATTSSSLQARTLCVIWKDAPRDVFFLRDELDTYKSFFDSIQGGIVESSFLDEIEIDREHGGFIPMQKQALGALLTKGASIAQSLGDILVELVGEQTERIIGNERLALRKKILWLRRMENVTKLRKMLRRTVDNVTLCLTMLDLQINIGTTATAQDASIIATIEQTELNIFSRLEETAESSRLEIQSTVERATSTLEQSLQSHIDRRLEASFSAMTARFEDNRLPGLQQRQRQLEAASESVELRGEHLVPADFAHRSRRSIYSLRTPPVLSDSVSRCRCKCHSSGRRYTSRWELLWFQHVLGSLRISYSGLTNSFNKNSTQSKCQSSECRAHAQQGYTRVVAQYQFPAWLARSIISLYFLQATHPELLIRIHRFIDTSDPDTYDQSIFAKINAKDIMGVKRLLGSCPSSVHDMDPFGISALPLAIGSTNMPMVKLLLQAGADPFRVDFKGSSPVRWALQWSLTKHASPKKQIAHMLPSSNVVEDDGYTELHRCILGIIPTDVKTALLNPIFRHQITTRTVDGITPLHLAVGHHSGTEVKLLLDAGADPNAKTEAGWTPLSRACQAGNTEAFEALIEAGASLHLTYRREFKHSTLLHDVMGRGTLLDTTELIDTLLGREYGLHINAVDSDGATPLMAAAYKNCFVGARHLVRNGANMDIVDDCGQTALHHAILYNSHESIRLLIGLESELRRMEGVGERYRIVNGIRGWGIVHYLAQYGDKETMEIFTGLNMTGLQDPETFRDRRGRTAGDLFRERVGGYIGIGPRVEDGCHDDQVDELIKAWNNLLASINIDTGTEADDESNAEDNHANTEDGGHEEGDSDDEFFDASEG